jgi:hypothetical protein
VKTRLIAAACLLAILPALAQERPAPRVRMRADIEFLSARALEGRASLSRGADAAAWFVAAEMTKAGLRPANGDSYLQRFDLVPVRLDHDRSAVVVHRGEAEERFEPSAVFFPDPTRPVALDLAVAFAGFGITAPELGYDDYAGLDVNGKAVLVFDHEPQEDDPASVFHGTGFTLHANAWTKTLNAQQHGASALLVVTEPLNRHHAAPRPPDRANAPPQALARGELRIPRVTISAETAAALLRDSSKTAPEWQRAIEGPPLRPASRELVGTRVSLRASNAETEARPSWNVAGLLPGSDPTLRGDTILIVAHYDHLGDQNGKHYGGANDNASGVAVLLETARQLAAAAHRPARSILFLAVGSEEQLMLGSYHYAANPLRPLATTRAVLTLDMVGRDEAHTPESNGAYEITAGRPDQLNVVGAVFSPDLAALLNEEARKAGLALSDKFDRDSSIRALFRCDHLPFLQKGVPAVWLFGGFHPGYHEPADTIDLLDLDKMDRVLRLTLSAARRLAGPGAAPRFRP